MVWAIVVVAIAVLGVAAWAGTGRLGEMPESVTDRPKAHLPEGLVDETFLEGLSLPIAGSGYRRSQVDAFLAAYVETRDLTPGTLFDVVRGGYDMQAVDAVIGRIGENQYADEDLPPFDEGESMAYQDTAGAHPREGASVVDGERVPLSEPVSLEPVTDAAPVIHEGSALLEEPKMTARGDSPTQ